MKAWTNVELGLQRRERGHKSLLKSISDEINTQKYTRVSACAAYASYKGVVLVRTALSNVGTPQYRWLIGLDDTITDPQAIKVAAGTYNSETRIVPVVAGRRFHIKAYLLDSAANESASLVIGSANLTESAFTKNCEGYVLFRAITGGEVNSLRSYWELLWRMGESATEERVSEYEERYRRRKFRSSEVEQENSDTVSAPREVKLVKQSVYSTKLAWIELGYNTGGGNQLDIVKKLAPFLGLPANPLEGRTVYLTFNSPLDQKDFQLTFTKGMWRFMNLQQGFQQRLRPDLTKPSPYLLIISREPNAPHPTLDVRRIDSRAAHRMIQHSKKNGFVDSSVLGKSGRLFGWY
jgi:HKD family nuclease